MIKVAVDTYSFHRFLGEVYDGQTPPSEELTYQEVLRRLGDWRLDGLCIETCFVDPEDEQTISELRRIAEMQGAEIIVAWGHPMGLFGGQSDEAQSDMERWIDVCRKLGSGLMRIVGSNWRIMQKVPREVQIKSIAQRLKESVSKAERAGVKLAIENHIDFQARDLVAVIEEVGSGSLGVTFDTGNALRIGENPVEAAEILAPYVLTTHVKDLAPVESFDSTFWAQLSTVPLGKGRIDIRGVVDVLRSHDYKGVYAVEVDYLHPDYSDEFSVVSESLEYLRNIQ